MKIPVCIRVARQSRSPEGFYALINGQRLHFLRKSDALAAIVSLLEMQRLQVVTVRQYAARQRKVKCPTPKNAASPSAAAKQPKPNHRPQAASKSTCSLESLAAMLNQATPSPPGQPTSPTMQPPPGSVRSSTGSLSDQME